jgi:hypothetical protein
MGNYNDEPMKLAQLAHNCRPKQKKARISRCGKIIAK